MNATMSRLSALENQNTELKTNVEEKDVVVMQSSEELDSQKKKNTEAVEAEPEQEVNKDEIDENNVATPTKTLWVSIFLL